MMTTSKTLKTTVAALFVTAAMGSQAIAQTTVYNASDSGSYQGVYYSLSNGTTVGDQIGLVGTERTITDFQFELYSPDASQIQGTRNGNFSIYQMDNGGNSVGSSIFDGTFTFNSASFDGSGFSTVAFTGLSVTSPDSITWAVELTDLDAGATVGLPVYNLDLGTNFNDFWEKASGGSWTTMVLENSTPSTFAAKVSAVPEPSTLLLGLLGSLTWLGYIGFRRRS
jgi:hypothetical protein